jgi:hypothetical protein
MALLSRPDIYGYTVFCDDIRQDTDGKFFYIGVYGSDTMFVHVDFPVMLPTFAFAISLSQRKGIFVPRVGLHIFLPGDLNSPSIQAEIGETSGGVVAAQLLAEAASFHPDARPSEEDPFLRILGTLKTGPLELKQPGRIRVKGIVGDNVIRLGSLAVSPPPPPRA